MGRVGPSRGCEWDGRGTVLPLWDGRWDSPKMEPPTK